MFLCVSVCVLVCVSVSHLPAHMRTCLSVVIVPMNEYLTFGRVYEFDLEEKELTAWSKKHSHRLPRFHMEKREVLQSISFNPARPTRVLLQARSYFCMVDFSQPVPKDDNKNALLNANGMVGTGKRKRGTKEERGTSKPKLSSYKNFYYINHYKPLLYAGFAQGDELVLSL